MSLVVYSTCSIQFIPKDKRRPESRYSDRSLVQLRQFDFSDYGLEGLDIANNKEEIFNIRLKEPDLYKFGFPPNVPDELRSNDGIYRLLLKAESRDGFHRELRRALDTLTFERRDSSNDKPKALDIIPSKREGSSKNKPKSSEKSTYYEPSRRTIPSNQNGILVDIHRLNEYIAQGDADKAAKVVTQLTSQGIPVQAKISTRMPNEKIFPIRVETKTNGRDEQFVINVYESTTIRELQANFKYTHKFPMSTQYFFTDGYLVDENASMNDLNIYPDSLLVLFIIQE